MRQKYYCPNCGAPVVCGESFCIGCGINFRWIAQPEPAQADPISYQLPGAGPAAQYQTASSQRPDMPTQPEQHQAPLPDGRGVQLGNSPLSAEVSKLLESFLDRRAKCHRA